MHLLRGTVQHYDWGDADFIPGLIGAAPDGSPWAEIWFGTHPGGPSLVETASGEVPLADITGELDVLVKVLAAARPLSLQTHPTRQQARAGFAREDEDGIDLDDPRRIYRDRGDKPELLVALTRFEALCGFAPVAASVEILERLGMVHEARTLLSEGIGGYLGAALTQRSVPLIERDTCPGWLARLVDLHPTDPALRVAPLLNHVVLEPGEAISLPAGNLHAYLSGAGVEVMAASDNVVRAGFTSKHTDVRELLRIVDIAELAEPVVRPVARDGRWHYRCPTTAFSVERIDLDGEHHLESEPRNRIVLVTDGEAGRLSRGRAAVLGANEDLHLSGAATVWLCAGSKF